MRLHTLSHLGDPSLGRHTQNLGQSKSGNSLYKRGNAYNESYPFQQAVILLCKYLVAEIFGRGGQHHARG